MYKRPHKFLDNIYCINLPTPFPVGDINLYLIVGIQTILIDTGPILPNNEKTWYETNIKILEDSLNSLDMSIKDIDKILITHAHIDHHGQAGIIKNISKAQILVHKKDSYTISYLCESFKKREDFYHKLCIESGIPQKVFFRLSKLYNKMLSFGESINVDETFLGGEILDISGYKIEIIHCPGHTPGHCVFLLKNEKILICGDNILNNVIPNPSIYIKTWKSGLKDYIKSLKYLKTLDIKLALPAHGKRIENVNQRIDEILSYYENRKQQVIKVLANNKKTLLEIYKEIYSNVKTDELSLIRELYGILSLLKKKLNVENINGVKYYEINSSI